MLIERLSPRLIEVINPHPSKIRFFQVMRGFARRRIRPGMTVLDIGSSKFRFAFLFPGVFYIGADHDHDVLRAGKARWPGAMHQPVRCTVTQLPFAEATFDIAVSTHTIVHVRGARGKAQAVAELARVVRPGGDLVFNIEARVGPEAIAEIEAIARSAFARVDRTAHRRSLMTWWEGRLIRSLERPGLRGLAFALAVLAPVVHALDRFGPNSRLLYVCEDRAKAATRT